MNFICGWIFFGFNAIAPFNSKIDLVNQHIYGQTGLPDDMIEESESETKQKKRFKNKNNNQSKHE